MDSSALDIKLVFAVMSGKVSSAINRRMYRNFRNAGLEITPEQWSVLVFLRQQQDKVTQKAIADATYKDRPSITRLIDNMEKQELVTRVQDSTDRRTNKICLTKKGFDLYEKIYPITLKTMQEALKGFSEEDISNVQYLLKKIFSNIEKQDECF
ncbi:MAG: MarR family transcriptional regulator [Prevotellaceae bacterium]|nr:MarR family transcriptional regulator [Prevotellaceae bacterium]